MSRALNFDQWKTFSKNYKPGRVWLWLVYKFTKNYCHSWLFSEFIQTQKRYPTSFDKIHNLTWKLLVISNENFSSELNLLFAKYLTSAAVTALLKLSNERMDEIRKFRKYTYFNNLIYYVKKKINPKKVQNT